jgi:type II secretory pathway component PulK
MTEQRRNKLNGTNRHRCDRNASILPVALVCLAVASTLMLSALRVGLQARMQLHTAHQVQQTRWLLDAGVRRALASLRKNADYDGETIRLDESLIRERSATLTIRVVRLADTSDDSNLTEVGAQASTVTVTAKLFHADDPQQTTQRSESFTFTALKD